MAEAELARVAEQQVEAHRGDDEDAGHDQHVQDVEVASHSGTDAGSSSQATVARASPDPLLPREQSRGPEQQDDDDEQEAHARRGSRTRRSPHRAPP